jgi:hypothetical protein
MGSRVSQENMRSPMPVAVWMAWPSGPGAVRKGRRFSVISTTASSQSQVGRRAAVGGEESVMEQARPGRRGTAAGR